jgi:hypothetical protein
LLLYKNRLGRKYLAAPNSLAYFSSMTLKRRF